MNKKQRGAFLGIAKFLKKAADGTIAAAVIVAALNGGVIKLAEVLALAVAVRVAAAVIEAVV